MHVPGKSVKREMEDLVYDLYGLTSEEKALVQSAAKLDARYGQAVRALAGQQHSIAVEICGI